MRGMQFALILTIAAFTTTCASGAPVQWKVADGGNGHLYEVFLSGAISWTGAHLDAQARGGYLATITSVAENDFVFALVDQPQLWSTDAFGAHYGPWLGGWQVRGAQDPGSDWYWVSGEPFQYSNWHPGEPNDRFGTLAEDRLQYFAHDDSTGERSAYWNDESVLLSNPVAYVVEFVPEPASLTLIILAAAGWCCLRRRRIA